MQMNTGITFKVYLLAKSKLQKQQGFLFLWKQKGQAVKGQKSIPFDALDELPAKILIALRDAKIDWPAIKV